MNPKQLIAMVHFVAMVLLLAPLHAKGNSTITVQEKSGKVTQFTKEEVRKIVFNPGEMSIELKNTNQNVFPLQLIQKVDFKTVQTSLKEVEKTTQMELLIYPSPAREQLKIKFRTENAGDATLRIYNSSGSLVLQQQLHCMSGINQTEFNLDGLTSGLYLLKIRVDDKDSTSKFIIQNNR